jgi:Flp pilus assembly protein TadD
MDIPSPLEAQIREGNAVLLLGAGASRDARDAAGNHPPSGVQLGAMLSDRFLGGKYKDHPLGQIGEYAISETDLTTVQEYIRGILEPFEPSDAHRLMTSFSWHGLATTNYDRLIERAYETTPTALQRPKEFIENGDHVDSALRDPRSVMLLKLHGCITRTSNRSCPLILTTDQYIEHRDGRSRIFDHLKNWAHEHPIVFVGHSLQDPDLRAILLELAQLKEARPRYFAIAPAYDDIEVRFWESKRITPLRGTFAEFMSALHMSIPSPFRGLAHATSSPSLPICKRFKVAGAPLSQACLQFLQTDIDYVKGIATKDPVAPSAFYKGVNPGWSAIEQGLDVPRRLGDSILSDHFLIPESEHLDRMEVVVVKAHAGAGKSVLLKRIAWDAAHDYDCLCLFVRPHGIINTAIIQELVNLCQERVYLFVDDAGERVRELQCLAKSIGPEGRFITIVTAERINEWNVSCGGLSSLVTADCELKYLTSKEIDSLLHLLERHRALGTLAKATVEERRAAFADRAGHQLLVALHEATLGRRFEEIIEDEFSSIQPHEAQRIYLTICVLNRLNVKVRAGIISRLHEVRFEDFRQRFFAPLEHIVQAEQDPVLRDYTYTARHPHIAEIVFDRVLGSQADRCAAFVACLQALNIDYNDDRRAYRQMVRSRSILELFPDHEFARRIYDVARNHIGEDAYLLHQMALYEMNRQNGSLHEAGDLLSRAALLAPHDLSIQHSMAEHRLRCAESARTPLEREKYLREASELSRSLARVRSDEPFGFNALIKIGLLNLEHAVASIDSGASLESIEEIVNDTERKLSDALQRFPGDPYLLDAEAKLAVLLSDSRRALEALQAAFVANPRNGFLAVRLAGCYQHSGDLEKAKEVLERALEANRSDRRLHFAYAKILMALGTASGADLAYHLERAFALGDSNLAARLLYGRQLFVNGEVEKCKAFFSGLWRSKIGGDLQDRLYPVDQTYHGRVVRLDAGYCFLARDGINDWIYAHRQDIGEGTWLRLVVGSRVAFRVAFNLRGPCGIQVEPELLN